MTKTLEELGKEYVKEIEQLDEKIERYRSRLKKAFDECNCDEAYRLQRLLRVFYGQRCEMAETAQKLLYYYS